MRAMILAAGLGTRLRPLTDTRPKALVELNGRTLLEITIARLREAGVHEIIINVHHFADQLIEYIRAQDYSGIRIEVSREDDLLLDTGGGLKQASWFFQGLDTPFLLHNVDILSSIDLGRMIQQHQVGQSIATLAVQARESSRRLLFDEKFRLCGRRIGGSQPEIVASAAQPQELAFCGIHVISPRLLPLITETGTFSIIDTYLRLASQGERIAGFKADGYYWRDLGRPEHLEQAEQDMRAALI